jgi:hypothetical protein
VAQRLAIAVRKAGQQSGRAGDDGQFFQINSCWPKVQPPRANERKSTGQACWEGLARVRCASRRRRLGVEDCAAMLVVVVDGFRSAGRRRFWWLGIVPTQKKTGVS